MRAKLRGQTARFGLKQRGRDLTRQHDSLSSYSPFYHDTDLTSSYFPHATARTPETRCRRCR
jgi:hypothetical protein